ncbi:MAG: sigma-54-dependent transcriptional regulator [Leptospirillia bacterium]
MAKILLVDDNPQNIELLSLRLSAGGHDTMEARDGEEALEMLHKSAPDLMILDMQMPKVDGLAVLKQLNEEHIEIPVVVISAFATVERAVDAMKAGALDFITKPFDPSHLELVVNRALERTKLEHQNRFLTEELNARYHFVLGKSPAMLQAYDAMLKAAPGLSPVHIHGDTGTGKETAARLIHRESERASGPFVTLRCGAGSPELVAAELFGTTEEKGMVELAAGGVLFLDDVSKLNEETQKNVLNMLETHGFTRVGGNTEFPSDVRVISASTVDLVDQVKAGTFREDLCQCLTAVNIGLPSLHERREDIPELISYFIEKFNREMGRDLKGISQEALEALSTYHWPGNVRELASIIERAVSTGQGEKIGPEDLGIAVRGLVGSSVPDAAPVEGTYEEQLDAARRSIVMAALRQSEGEIGRAAAALGMSEERLGKLIPELKIRK